jgi:pimeloyl-ACP methyl ester carboxylesterase
MIRRRRISSNDPGKDEVGVQDTITFFTTDITALNTLGASIWTYLARAAGKLQATIRIASFLFMGYGFFLSQTLLFTSEECGMTYSWRRFLELDISSIHPVGRSPYRLYKFYDQRDPRHERFLQQESVTTSRKASTDWCLNAAFPTAVVYIPGHGGSYQQSRSLGAHGIQLTRQRDVTQNYVVQALQKGMWHGNATQLENFVYDVYALDFAEEGGGMHGDFLVDQSRFVSKAIHFLSEACGFSGITVVAHSIGGISIRLALVRDEKLRLLVTNVILLGSPQARTVLAWDPSLEKIQTEIVENHVNGTAFVAISGGLRDEMIPPAACELVPKDNNTLTLLAVDIMPKEASSPSFGMDHRAIVWCHNVLVPLRKIIFALVRSERDGEAAPARIGAVQSLFDRSKTQNYNTALQRMMTTFRVRIALRSVVLLRRGPLIQKLLLFLKENARTSRQFSHGNWSPSQCRIATGFICLHLPVEVRIPLFGNAANNFSFRVRLVLLGNSKAGFASCFNSHFGVFSGRNPSYFVVDSTSVISTEADDVPKQRDKLALGGMLHRYLSQHCSCHLWRRPSLTSQ